MKFAFPRILVLSTLSACICASAESSQRTDQSVLPAPAEHVVLIICDGLRPDSVTERDMPTLHRMAASGTRFANHHPAYLSSTEVNGTALATGMLPRKSGIFANKEYRPRIDPSRPIDTEAPNGVRMGDEVTGGKYLGAWTVAEILQHRGKRTVVAGTKPVVLLMDRQPRGAAVADTSVNLIFDRTLPPALSTEIRSAFGAPPRLADPSVAANLEQDRWTTQVLIDGLLKDQLPSLTVLWLSEPDFAQHGSGPGSTVARAALRSSDDNLKRILGALERAGVAAKTDVLVVSDHGFSTISKAVDFVKLLRSKGFRAFREFAGTPANGDIMVVGNGGSVLFYVIGHDDSTVARLAKFLQCCELVGVVLSRRPLPGTFSMDAVGISPEGDCDLVVSLHWSHEISKTGMPGTVVSEGLKRLPGQGHHASLSRFDMHNTMIAIGPSFRTGFVDELPTGNVDVAPTILRLLGMEAAAKEMDGRVLTEALKSTSPMACTKLMPQSLVLDSCCSLGQKRWRQYLRFAVLGKLRYIVEGNGGLTADNKAP